MLAWEFTNLSEFHYARCVVRRRAGRSDFADCNMADRKNLRGKNHAGLSSGVLLYYYYPPCYYYILHINLKYELTCLKKCKSFSKHKRLI